MSSTLALLTTALAPTEEVLRAEYQHQLTMNVQQNQLTFAGLHRYCLDASDLRLRPGIFPAFLVVSPPLGNSNRFTRVSLDDISAEYVQDAGCAKITVFND